MPNQPFQILSEPADHDTLGSTTTEDVTCLACGCLCDDLRITANAGKVVEVESACQIGRRWFEQKSLADTCPSATIDGQVVDAQAALDRVVSILRESRSPVLFGLNMTVTETVREAIRVADRIGARLILNRSDKELRRVAAFQNLGRVSATLGEVKGRGDVVVFWNCDPVRTHPRHFERYSVEPRGRFVPEGRTGRLIIVIDQQTTETARVADLFVPIDAKNQLFALLTLRSMIAGRSIGSRERAGLDLDVLVNIASHLKKARYGAFFFDEPAGVSGHGAAHWEAATKLVRSLNESTRFVMLGLGRAGNLAGGEAALTWQSGFLQGVDFRTGSPRPIDHQWTLENTLISRETDAILIVADDWPETLSVEARTNLMSIPRIAISPSATRAGASMFTIGLASATAGFDAGGTVTRVDGVCLPVRAIAPATAPTDREWLGRILDHMPDRRGTP